MLAYILAIAVAVGSFALYMAAFFFPEVHRKSDFIWSGVGLFYALVLWVCAGRITGGVLLGQIASVALVGWLGWETLTLRRSLTPAAQQTEIPSPEALQEKLTNLSLPQRITGLFTNLKDKAQQTASKVTQPQSKSGTGTTQPGTSKTTEPAPATDTEKPRVTMLDNRKPDEDEDETVLLNQPPVPPAPSQPEVVSTPSEESVRDRDLDDLEPPASVEAATTGETVTTAPETAPSSPSEDELEPPASVEAATTGETVITAPETAPSSSSELEANPENVLEPVRPNPPDPELVEAALEDAEEKHIPASPPEPAHEETSDSVSGTEQANQPLENPPNPT